MKRSVSESRSAREETWGCRIGVPSQTTHPVGSEWGFPKAATISLFLAGPDPHRGYQPFRQLLGGPQETQEFPRKLKMLQGQSNALLPAHKQGKTVVNMATEISLDHSNHTILEFKI